MLFGFYMDQHQNRIGASGWDFVKGNILGEYEVSVKEKQGD